MTDQFSIESKKQEVEAMFSAVGFDFHQFEIEAFEHACKKLEQQGMEIHVNAETTVTRAKITTPEEKNYQLLYDGNLHVS